MMTIDEQEKYYARCETTVAATKYKVVLWFWLMKFYSVLLMPSQTLESGFNLLQVDLKHQVQEENQNQLGLQ